VRVSSLPAAPSPDGPDAAGTTVPAVHPAGPPAGRGRSEGPAPRAAIDREPALCWRDADVPPATGAFAACAVANAALSPAAVPAEGDDWDRLNEFALTYDGYAYWDNLPELARRAVARWTRDGSLPGTLDELRACLFYEQRRWHHFGAVPRGRAGTYLWALATEVRTLVARGQLEALPSARGEEHRPDPARRATGTPAGPRPARPR